MNERYARGGTPIRPFAVRGEVESSGQQSRLEPASPLRDSLQQAICLLAAESPMLTSHAEALADLVSRLDEGRFHLAILGQFKRGKSTFVNALLGEGLLPAAIVPLTALPTFLRGGARREATVFFEDDRPPETLRAEGAREISQFIGRYVAETENPRNRLGVERVEIADPAPLLRQGLVLIDTPGIGSTFTHNTEVTLNFLPQCDAAIFVVSADPPITQVELSFLKEVSGKVERLLFVLNKADYLAPDDVEIAVAFLRRVLKESKVVSGDPVLHAVSSLWALESRAAGDAALWQRSGMGAVLERLAEFLATEKAEALQAAIARKAFATVSEALLEVRLLIHSLELPLESLEERRRLFEEKIAEAEQQRLQASDLMAGTRNRLLELLETQADSLRKKSRKSLGDIARQAMEREDGMDEAAAREALAEAIPLIFERELGGMSREFNRLVAEALRPHEQRAANIIAQVRRGAADIFEIPYQAPQSDSAFVPVRAPYWVTHKWSSSLSPLPEGFLDRLLPLRWRRQIVHRRLGERIEELVVSNVENLRWSTLQNLDTSFRRFAADLDERLRRTAEATRRAIRAAAEKRDRHADAVAEAMALRQDLATRLETLAAALEPKDCTDGERK
jgi:GTPase SAR1 family protein